MQSFRNASGLSVLVNSTSAAGSGTWVALNVAAAAAGAGGDSDAAGVSVVVDLAPLGEATPQAVGPPAPAAAGRSRELAE